MNNSNEKTSLKAAAIPCVGGNALIIVPFMGEKYYKLFSPLQKETESPVEKSTSSPFSITIRSTTVRATWLK